MAGCRRPAPCKRCVAAQAQGFGKTKPKQKAQPGGKGGAKGTAGKKAADATAAQLKQQQAMLAALSGKADEADQSPVVVAADDDGAGFVTIKSQGSKRPVRRYKRIEGALYDQPMYYDWAFGFRSHETEVDFLFDAYEEVTGVEPSSFLEIGCGPAQHSLEMAESGLEVFALDSNQRMLDYAAELAKADDLSVNFLRQDMRELTLPGDAQVDLAACLFGTFQHMHKLEDAVACVKAVERALKPGGLFLVELSHPAAMFDGSVISSADFWNVELDDAQVEVFWGQEGDVFNPMTQILDKTVQVNILIRGGEMLQIEEVVPLRQFTYQEMLLLAHIAGFKVVNAYNDFNLSSSMLQPNRAVPTAGAENDRDDDDESNDGEDDDAPFRMIMLLQKPLAAESAVAA